MAQSVVLCNPRFVDTVNGYIKQHLAKSTIDELTNIILLFYAKRIEMKLKCRDKIESIQICPVTDTFQSVCYKIQTSNLSTRQGFLDSIWLGNENVNISKWDNLRWSDDDIFMITFDYIKVTLQFNKNNNNMKVEFDYRFCDTPQSIAKELDVEFNLSELCIQEIIDGMQSCLKSDDSNATSSYSNVKVSSSKPGLASIIMQNPQYGSRFIDWNDDW